MNELDCERVIAECSPKSYKTRVAAQVHKAIKAVFDERWGKDIPALDCCINTRLEACAMVAHTVAGLMERFEQAETLAEKIREHGPKFVKEVIAAMSEDLDPKALFEEAKKEYESGEFEKCDNPWSLDGKDRPDGGMIGL